MLAAGLLAALSAPGQRLPYQDLLWNDLVLLAKIDWVRSALLHHPLASIDFRQGLGHPILADPKIIPHLFEPAALLATVMPATTAVLLRNGLLALLCLVCLYRLFPEEAAPSVSSLQKTILCTLYLLTPQFYHEVANAFSVVFLAVPPFVLALRRCALKPDWRTWLQFVTASVLLVSLSDLHIFALIPTIVAWLVLADRAPPRRALIRLGAVTMALALAAYWPLLWSTLARAPGIVQQTGTTLGVGAYLVQFVGYALASLALPLFAGPISLYLNPIVYAALAMVALRREPADLVRDLRKVAGLFLGLALLGILSHAITPIRDRLPSALRYHLGVIPYLALLTAVLRAPEILAVPRTTTRGLIVAAGAALGLGLALQLALLALVPSARTTELVAAARSATGGALLLRDAIPIVLHSVVPGVALYLADATLLPLALVLAGGMTRARWDRRRLAAIGLLAASLFVQEPLTRYAVPAFNWHYRSPAYRSAALEQVPACLNRLIAGSPYASAARSFIPIARGFGSAADLGRNDKLLPLIELPELVNGRAFFQWRYAYAAPTAAAYAQVSGSGRIANFFPPPPARLEETIAFARATASPFLVAADFTPEDGRLTLLGSCDLPFEVPLNRSLGGRLSLYAVTDRAVPVVADAGYSRTEAWFRLDTAAVAPSRLPIAFHRDLRARSGSGARVPITEGSDGYAYVAGRETGGSVTVSSVAWTRAIFPALVSACYLLAVVFI